MASVVDIGAVVMAAQDQWMDAICTLKLRRRMSERKLCALAKVNRATFRKALRGESDITLNDLDSILTVLGYEMDASPIQQRDAA